jgi:hypothetical protein
MRTIRERPRHSMYLLDEKLCNGAGGAIFEGFDFHRR